MVLGQDWLLSPCTMLTAFACNTKNFAIDIIFFFLLFSTANLDGMMKVACSVLYIC